MIENFYIQFVNKAVLDTPLMEIGQGSLYQVIFDGECAEGKCLLIPIEDEMMDNGAGVAREMTLVRRPKQNALMFHDF